MLYLVEIITDTDYFTHRDPVATPEEAEGIAAALRAEMAGSTGYVAVRVINLAFATRR
jgi:hypothetical protein